MLLFGHDKEIAAWVAGQIPYVTEFGPNTAIGVLSGDRLIAGVVYTSYRPKYANLEMSIASISPMWATKENIAGLLRYPFEQLKCYKVYSATLLGNKNALKTLAHIGFKKESILAHQFGKKKHAVIMRMLLPDYRRLYGDMST